MNWQEYVDNMFNYSHVQVDLTLHRNIWQPGITGVDAREYIDTLHMPEL